MLDREFFLGFIKIHILYHASKEPIYGVEIAKELIRHGHYLSPGHFIPLRRDIGMLITLPTKERMSNIVAASGDNPSLENERAMV